jgi:hypothetical protein
MTPDYSSVVGGDGHIAKSGKNIYDSLHDSPDFFLAGGDLEAILRAGLVGLDLNYPLRTRSKVLKSKICEVLGYPVPASFKKSKPRFPGQDFDTYVQKSNTCKSGTRKSRRRGATSSSGWMKARKLWASE